VIIIQDFSQFSASSEVAASHQLFTTDHLLHSASIAATNEVQQSPHILLTPHNSASSHIHGTDPIWTNLFGQSASLPPSAVRQTFLFLSSPAFNHSVSIVASQAPSTSEFMAFTAFHPLNLAAFQRSILSRTAVAESTDHFAASRRLHDSPVYAVTADQDRTAKIGMSDNSVPSATIAVTFQLQPSSVVFRSNPFNNTRKCSETNNFARHSSQFNPSSLLPPIEVQSQTSQLKQTSQLCVSSVIVATELLPTLLFVRSSSIADSSQFSAFSEIAASHQLLKTDHFPHSAPIAVTDALQQSPPFLLSPHNSASSQIHGTNPIWTDLFGQSARLPPSAVRQTFLFLLSPAFNHSISIVASREPSASQFVAVTAFRPPDSAAPPHSDRISKTKVFLASANLTESQTQTFDFQSSSFLSTAKTTVEIAEANVTVQTREAQSADSVAGSGGGAVSAIHPRSLPFVQSVAERQTLHQQTMQLRQSVGQQPSLTFQASAALTAAAEVIRDFSATAKARHERRVSVGGIVGIVVGVAAAVAAAVIAVACSVLASRRKAAESAVFPETEMSDESIDEPTSATFVSQNAPSESGSEGGLWSDDPDEGGFSA
jgi:hypothetical protein